MKNAKYRIWRLPEYNSLFRVHKKILFFWVPLLATYDSQFGAETAIIALLSNPVKVYNAKGDVLK